MGGNVAKSKFDESLLTPMDEKPNKVEGFDESMLAPIQDQQTEEEQFLPPKKTASNESFIKDIILGGIHAGRNAHNLPHDLAKGAEERTREIGSLFKSLPGSEVAKNNPSVSDYLPYDPRNFGDVLGQEGEPTGIHKYIQKGVEYAPEIYQLAKLGIRFTPERLKDLFSYKGLKKEAGNLGGEIKNAETKINAIEEEGAQESNQAKTLQNQANLDIGKHLNKGANHAVKLAAGIGHRLGNIENYWKGSYKNLKDTLKNSEFKMQDLPQYNNDIEHVIKNIKDLKIVDGKFVIANEPEVSSQLQSIISKAPTSEDVSASDFLSKYQDFRDARYNLLQQAKTATTSAERRALFKAYEDSKPIEETVSKALNEGLGPHKAEFQRVNEGYSKQVYPLRGNKVAKKALGGKVGPNTIEDLAGNGEGQELMREIVKQDPELLRNIIGQRYASKPELLKDIDETTLDYLHEMPELQTIMSENENKILQQLEKVNAIKSKKEISLKEKIHLENQAKELKQKLARVRKDISKIWRGTKKAATYGTALYLGGSALSHIIGGK